MLNDQTVFVIERDLTAYSEVAALLNAHGVRTQWYSHGEEFLFAYNRREPGCLIAELRLLDMDCCTLQQRLVADAICLPAIYLASRGEVALAVRVMQAGAIAVQEKPYQKDELWRNVSNALRIGQSNWQKQQEALAITRCLDDLSEGERRVLDLLMQGNSNKRIAVRLDLGLRTVEKYRHYILKKMHVESLAELVRAVLQVQPHEETSELH